MIFMKPIRLKGKKRWIGPGIYMALWILTGVLGLPQVDHAFDEQYATGSLNAFSSPRHSDRRVPVRRLRYERSIDPSDQSLPEIPFRSRSNGIPIGPFLILDEVCVVQTPLAGFSGRRLVFWFFGYNHWIPLKTWWVV